MPSLFMRASRVVAFSPRILAALLSPLTRQLPPIPRREADSSDRMC